MIVEKVNVKFGVFDAKWCVWYHNDDPEFSNFGTIFDIIECNCQFWCRHQKVWLLKRKFHRKFDS